MIAVKNSNVFPDIVLEPGAEGGLLRFRENQMRSRAGSSGQIDETMLYDMLSEEDRGGMRQRILREPSVP